MSRLDNNFHFHGCPAGFNCLPNKSLSPSPPHPGACLGPLRDGIGGRRLKIFLLKARASSACRCPLWHGACWCICFAVPLTYGGLVWSGLVLVVSNAQIFLSRTRINFKGLGAWSDGTLLSSYARRLSSDSLTFPPAINYIRFWYLNSREQTSNSLFRTTVTFLLASIRIHVIFSNI